MDVWEVPCPPSESRYCHAGIVPAEMGQEWYSIFASQVGGKVNYLRRVTCEPQVAR